MSKIRTLDPKTVSQIAAGQVADKPASIVKELIENAIDANATQISIEIESAGLNLIRVVDNGVGISKKDISLALQPHTTSKIRSAEDLSSIHTFGFRGEALASIAAMGEVLLKSKTRSHSHGYVVTMQNGLLSDVIPIGIQQGTIVEVRNLYAHVPARKKSVESNKKEESAITHAVVTIALVHPEIEFHLKVNGKLTLNLSVDGERERVEQLLGSFISAGLIPVSAQDKGIQVHGYVGTPQLAIKQKTREYLYVNKRPIQHDAIASTVKQLYGTLLDPRLHPAFILFIDIPADLVDVNINPHKDSVAFHAWQDLQKLVNEAISPVLDDTPHRYQFEIEPSMDKKTAFVLKDAVSKWSVTPEKLRNNTFIQVDNTYLVTQTNTSLLIIDQHAAHERILYEQYLRAFKTASLVPIKLKRPFSFSLPKHELLQFKTDQKVFSQLGFHTKVVENTIVITHMPEIFADRNVPQILSEVLHDHVAGSTEIDSTTNKTLSFLACKSAIKSGDELSADESRRLLEKLFKTNTQYTCPHGRPVMIEIPLSQLHIAFRRK